MRQASHEVGDNTVGQITLIVADNELGKGPVSLRGAGYRVLVVHPSEELRKDMSRKTIEGIRATLAYESYVRDMLDTVNESDHVVVTPEAEGTHLGACVLGFLQAAGRYPTPESELVVLLDSPRYFNEE